MREMLQSKGCSL